MKLIDRLITRTSRKEANLPTPTEPMQHGQENVSRVADSKYHSPPASPSPVDEEESDSCDSCTSDSTLSQSVLDEIAGAQTVAACEDLVEQYGLSSQYGTVIAHRARQIRETKSTPLPSTILADDSDIHQICASLKKEEPL